MRSGTWTLQYGRFATPLSWNIKKEEAIFVGDQLFTDILGANRSGIASILVKFIQLDNETKIGKRRQAEKVILNFYKRNKTAQNRLGDVIKRGGKLEDVVQ